MAAPTTQTVEPTRLEKPAALGVTRVPLAAGSARRVLVISPVYPSQVAPDWGVFVQQRINAVAGLAGYDVRVLSPVPYCPQVLLRLPWLGGRVRHGNLPHCETVQGLHVYRPRYLFLPGLGGYVHPALMLPAIARVVRSLRKEWDFDLIDAHWAYPTGVAAVRLGRRLGKPVVITGRGEDMLCFPDYPFKGRRIRWAIQHASHMIALSREIAEAFRRNGADPERISVIPNGVDTEKFRPLPMAESRRKLGLPADAKIILSVGDRLELKGFHLLVEALPEIRRQHPQAFLVIVGGPGRHGRDYTAQIKRRIRRLGLQDRVLLAGRRPHEELPWWYSAADVFALMSSREGSPNVILESLACGTPVVATAVGSVPDDLSDERLGTVLAEWSPATIALGISETLNRDWNRQSIRELIQSRNWPAAAGQVQHAFLIATQACRLLQ